jgi:hypothetical protein
MMKIEVLSPRLFAESEDSRSTDGDMNPASPVRKQEVYTFYRGAFGLSHMGTGLTVYRFHAPRFVWT